MPFANALTATPTSPRPNCWQVFEGTGIEVGMSSGPRLASLSEKPRGRANAPAPCICPAWWMSTASAHHFGLSIPNRGPEVADYAAEFYAWSLNRALAARRMTATWTSPSLAAPDTGGGYPQTRRSRPSRRSLRRAGQLGVPGVLAGYCRARARGACLWTAFTVTYPPSQRTTGPPSATRRNYLDDVPAGSVVVVEQRWQNLLYPTGAPCSPLSHWRVVWRGNYSAWFRARCWRDPCGWLPACFSTGVTMVSGKNRVELDAVGRVIDVHGIAVRPGDVVLAGRQRRAGPCRPNWAEEVLRRATRVDATERNIAAAVTVTVKGWTRHASSSATPLHGRTPRRPGRPMIDPSTRFVDIHYHAGVDLYQRRHTTRVAGQRYAEQQRLGGGEEPSRGRTAAQAWEAGRRFYQCRVL